MSSQYALIASQWPDLHAEAVRVEQFALSDPRTACFYARRTIELLVEWVYDNDAQLQRPLGYGSLADLCATADFRDIARDQLHRFHLIRTLGNKAVHRIEPIRPGEAVTAATELFQVLRWLVRTYGLNPEAVQGFSFDRSRLPNPQTSQAAAVQTREQLEALAEQLAERDRQLRDQRLAALASQEELDRLRQEITALRRANQAAAQPETEVSEYETRRAYIDVYLEEAGWLHGQSCTHEHAVQGMPNATGQGFVDYVLWGDDGKPLALVEAKRCSRDPLEGQRQAELYANCLEQRYGQRPLIFLSNGYRHRLWDDLRYPPREVQGFYKQDELETLIRRREIRQPLAQATISTAITDRYYQHRAIRAICESLEQGRLKALLVQATGTGKTRTAISLTDVLTRCNWVKRVLFLADRTSLVLQAERAFRRFLPDCSPVNLVTFKPISVPLKFPREGIQYADLSAEEKLQRELTDWEEDVQASGRVDSGAINGWLFNADTVDKGLQVLMTQGCLNGAGDRIGKSIIFARNHKHALFIQERFDHHFPHLAGRTARVIDNQTPYAH